MKFEAGSTYWYLFAKDEDHTRHTVEVVRRTEKSVLILKNDCSKARWKRIGTYSTGEEFFYPEGHFTRCPVCSASHKLEDSKPQNEEKQE